MVHVCRKSSQVNNYVLQLQFSLSLSRKAKLLVNAVHLLHNSCFYLEKIFLHWHMCVTSDYIQQIFKCYACVKPENLVVHLYNPQGICPHRHDSDFQQNKKELGITQ